MDRFGGSGVVVLRSADDGDSWDELAEIPNPLPGTRFCEPHALGLPDGRILCQLRLEGEEYFSVWQSESADGGRTWSPDARIAGRPVRRTSCCTVRGCSFPPMAAAGTAAASVSC